MRFVPTCCLAVSLLVASARCGSSGRGSTADAGAEGGSDADIGVTCTGQQAVCSGHPFAACVEVQQSLGHCIDWSMVGASSCPTGPGDCPSALPSASFPASAGSSASAVCVKETSVQFTAGAATPGYCAAIESYTDSSGAATCTPNPCGANGYCSYVHAASGSIVSCMWPI